METTRQQESNTATSGSKISELPPVGFISVARLIFPHLMHGRAMDPALVRPCHHGMARPQVADKGTASDKEGSCE